MTDTKTTMPTETGHADITRFNAPRQQDQATLGRRSRHGCAISAKAEGYVATYV